ncbi:sugar ABC transporter permease [[Mycoplasma] testudinis]|uniref:sugar ABC transporter permease n=1 Tax=[Mycoplasma] testudinis TaxID=33924 RepID=UPI000697BFB1|nr:sugar ABC transporter permease [[Mycoplasma] testudinis]
MLKVNEDIKKKKSSWLEYLARFCKNRLNNFLNYWKENWIGLLFLIPLIFLIILFSIIPIIETFKGSFTFFPFSNTRLITETGIKNFTDLVKTTGFKNAIDNTSFVMFLTTPISIIFGLFFAMLISSMFSKFSKNFFITSLYSQFFISSFAIGISFTFLFGQKNAMSNLLNLGISFGAGENSRSILWVYFIFQMWRSFPFNVVIFHFAINKANLKYLKSFKIDKLKVKEKFLFIYWFELKRSFANVIYTNFIFAALIYPPAFVDFSDLSSINGQTITSFIYQFFVPTGNSIRINFQLAYAASLIFFSYIVFVLFLVWLVRWKNLLKYYALFGKINRLVLDRPTVLMKKGVTNND